MFLVIQKVVLKLILSLKVPKMRYFYEEIVKSPNQTNSPNPGFCQKGHLEKVLLPLDLILRTPMLKGRDSCYLV